MMALHYIEETGILHSAAQGETSRRELEAYLYVLDAMAARARREWGRCLHILDASDAGPGLDCLAGSAMEQLKEGDRAAVILTAPDAIARVAAMPSQALSVVFPDCESARAWLVTPYGTAH